MSSAADDSHTNGAATAFGYWKVVRDISATGLIFTLMVWGYRDFRNMHEEHNRNLESAVEKGMSAQTEEMQRVGGKLDTVAEELRATRSATERLEWKLVNTITGTKGKSE